MADQAEGTKGAPTEAPVIDGQPLTLDEHCSYQGMLKAGWPAEKAEATIRLHRVWDRSHRF